jgi:chaperonin GroEL
VIELIATAFAKVGKEGVITVEEAKGQTLTWMLWKECSLIEGIFLHFVTNSEKMEVELEDPYIII